MHIPQLCTWAPFLRDQLDCSCFKFCIVSWQCRSFDLTGEVGELDATTLKVDGLDVESTANAQTSIEAVRDAINVVSKAQGYLGAMQNRFEHAINNIDVTAENMTSSNSRIHDTNMAKQMMEYTKMNVLTQSAQAMLAQANQQPQSILQVVLWHYSIARLPRWEAGSLTGREVKI